MVPVEKTGVEIGIGSGIFAEQTGIRFGIDLSEKMLEYARQRGLEVQNGVAENLPYENESFDFAVFITSICFVENPELAVKEAYRILKNQGEIIITILEKKAVLESFWRTSGKRACFTNMPFFSQFQKL